MMRWNFILLQFVVLAAVAQPVTLQPVEAPGSVGFVVENFGLNVSGSFSGIKGLIQYDAANYVASRFDVTVQAATVNTSNAIRDKHLRGADYFDVQNFPTIRLVSVRIAKSVTPGYLVFTGQLTIKNISKEVVFPFKAEVVDEQVRFTAKFRIKRRDFGVGGRSTVSNDVEILLQVVGKKL